MQAALSISSAMHRILVSITVVLASALASAQTTQRPIQDFVIQQGTYCFPADAGGCVIFVPGVPNYVGWGNSSDPQILASVDYAGLANRVIEAASPGFSCPSGRPA